MQRKQSLSIHPARATPIAQPGFTLVELLVVIGIIGVLIGFTMPVLSKARQRGVAVQCASNLHQIAIGWQMYAQAYKGISVPARMPLIRGSRNLYDIGNGPTYRPRWYEFLAAQTKHFAFSEPSPADDDDREIENPVFLCPGVPDWKNARNYCYGYNYQFLGNPRQKTNGKYINYPVNTARIRAAETVLAADSMGTAGGRALDARRAYQGNGGRDQGAWGNHGYTLDPPRLTATSDYAEWRHRDPRDRSAPDPRHHGKANVAFCDGHVETSALEDLGYHVRVTGRIDVDDFRCRNNKFSGTGRDDDPPSVQ